MKSEITPPRERKPEKGMTSSDISQQGERERGRDDSSSDLSSSEINIAFHGYDVRFNPFHAPCIAVVGYQPNPVAIPRRRFGRLDHITNPVDAAVPVHVAPRMYGRLEILKPSLPYRKSFYASKGLTKCCWLNNNLIIVGNISGSIMAFNIEGPAPVDRDHTPDPIFRSVAHESKISSLEHNVISPYLLTTASDYTVKVWTVLPDKLVSFVTFNNNRNTTSSIWNPCHGHIFACAGRALISLYDMRSCSRSFDVENASEDYLSCDWNRENEALLATASKGFITIWDVRNTQEPYMVHEIVSRKLVKALDGQLKMVKFLPGRHIASSSYKGVSVWNYNMDNPLIRKYAPKVPVFGFDVSRHVTALMASTGGHGTVHIWNSSGVQQL